MTTSAFPAVAVRLTATTRLILKPAGDPPGSDIELTRATEAFIWIAMLSGEQARVTQPTSGQGRPAPVSGTEVALGPPLGRLLLVGAPEVYVAGIRLEPSEAVRLVGVGLHRVLGDDR